MTRSVVIGLGSSLRDGDRVIARALDDIKGLAQTTLHSTSDLVRTAAFGGQTVTPFWNGACVVSTSLAPATLLCALHAIERAHGRVRVMKNAARALDLDLLLVEDHVVDTARRHDPLVPHPGLRVRASALFPARQAWARGALGPMPNALHARVSSRGILVPSSPT
jgi:2-amino-4-hydroxy-6-hydroxymethyldihydropteridine diphosphokinase